MEKLHFKTYSELCRFIDENEEKCELVIDYDEFCVYKIQNQYFFMDIGEGDVDEFYEVEIIAELKFSILHDLQVKDGEELHSLFDCDCCGEQVTDDYISYLWFKEVKNHD